MARVTLNRPEVYNAFSAQTLREMVEAFRDASWDDSVAVVVLTGAGDKAFCSGSDAKEFAQQFLRRPRNFWKYQGLLLEALELFRHVGKPTVARLNGVVAGAGNDWNLAADLAIAADHVRFIQVGTRVGLVEAWGTTQWLPLVVGERRAREMLLKGEEITAEQALSWGLVNEVVPYKQLDRAVHGAGGKAGPEPAGVRALHSPTTGLLEGPGVGNDGRACARLVDGPLHLVGASRGRAGLYRQATGGLQVYPQSRCRRGLQ